MFDLEIGKRIIYLRELLNKYNYYYYALDQSLVSDNEFDLLMNELLLLEKEHPDLKTIDSPTNIVGGFILDKFKKIVHSEKMLSLQNTFNKEEIERFILNIKKETEDFDLIIEPKIDGLSISIIYKNSKLFYAVTRGDGITGEDVTSNILTISEIPKFIDHKYKDLIIEIRGEIYISKSNFEILNADLEDNEKFSNPRNAAAGGIRNLNSSIAKERKLQLFSYAIINPKLLGLKSQFECLNWLKENNFPVNPDIIKTNCVYKLMDKIEWFQINRDNLNYPIDGVVIKLNDFKYYDELGTTSKFPKWAIAYKFEAISAITRIINVIFQIGRTGKITYVADLIPVKLEGSVISKASLHNFDFIVNKDIRINDYIEIYKAGEVIPYISNVCLDKRDESVYKFIKPINCPFCNFKLVMDENKINQICYNPFCHEKIIRQIEYFASKSAMDISGLSYSTVKKLYEEKIISNYLDLYLLYKWKEEVINNKNLRIKEKSFNNLILSIENSKNNSLEKLITAIQIKCVGPSLALNIAKKFKNLNTFFRSNLEDLENLNIVGKLKATFIFDFINEIKNKKLLIEIEEIGINTIYKPDLLFSQFEENISIIDKNKYSNKSFVITGTFDWNRQKIKLYLEQIYNAKLLNQINKKVDYLIVGKNPGSKLKIAKQLNVNLITEKIWG